MSVLPYRWKGADAEAFAQERDAVLAVWRLEAAAPGSPSALSLSPSTLLTGPAVPRLVLPSPNGSTIATILVKSGASVVAGCLRNATAVSDWLAIRMERGDSGAIIAAGERWRDDDSLRPALEDHLGAGAILSALSALGYWSAMSPEAQSAAGLSDAVRPRLDRAMRDCVGAREWASRLRRVTPLSGGSARAARPAEDEERDPRRRNECDHRPGCYDQSVTVDRRFTCAPGRDQFADFAW